MKSEPQAVMSIASCCLAIPGIAGNLISVVILSAPGLRSRFSNLLICLAYTDILYLSLQLLESIVLTVDAAEEEANKGRSLANFVKT